MGKRKKNKIGVMYSTNPNYNFEFEQEEEEDYQDELEYVEVEQAKQKMKNKKQLYLENDFSDEEEYKINQENQIGKDKNINFEQQKLSRTNLASKRPIERTKEPLDIEPLEEKNLVIEDKKQEQLEIDDPW